MLLIRTTPKLAGIHIYGTSAKLDRLYDLFGEIFENYYFLQNQQLVDYLFSISHELRKAYEGQRNIEKEKDLQDKPYYLYGTGEIILPFFLLAMKLVRKGLSLRENSKRDLALMYEVEAEIEDLLQQYFAQDMEDINRLLNMIVSLPQDDLYEKMYTRFYVYLDKSKAERQKLLLPILKSFLPSYRTSHKFDFTEMEWHDEIDW